MTNSYDVGAVVRSSIVFQTISGVVVDPGAVTFKEMPLGGVVSSFVNGTATEVVKDSTGKYHIDVSVNVAGQHKFRWEGTGTNAAAAQETVLVRPDMLVSGA